MRYRLTVFALLAVLGLAPFSGTASAASSSHFAGAFAHPRVVHGAEPAEPETPQIGGPAASVASVTLIWIDNANPSGTTYSVRRGNSPTACTGNATPSDTCTLLNAAPITTKTFTDNPTLGSNYYYYVRAQNPNLMGANGVLGGESGNSPVSIVTLSGIVPVGNVTCTITIVGGVVNGTCK